MSFRSFALYISSFFFIILFLLLPVHTVKNEFKVYRVVLDPGHGGFYGNDKQKHGDRYDSVTGKYLSYFAPGAAHRGVEEHVVMYEIAAEVHRLLKFTETPDGYKDFKKIIKKFSNKVPERIVINSNLIRPDSRNREEILSREDPNAEFRLFDYPDEYGIIQPGRISKINKFKPHLVVSLHCDFVAPKAHRSFDVVVVPPYNFLKKGRWFMEDRSRSIDFFRNSPYSNWFMESGKRSSFQWYINDVVSYYTGFSLNADYSYDRNSFSGFRYNMVDWKYSDVSGWEKYYNDPNEGQYSKTLENFQPIGSFWLRERSVFEEYRRSEGYEGYGGDNFYAGTELLRFMLTSLKISGKDHRLNTIGDPYFSIWSVPLHVNAISAYVEIGYVKSRHFRKMLTRDQKELAEGIAVGIYSMFTGMQIKDIDYKYKPKGKKIDLDKYMISDKTSYFDIVTDYE